MSYGSDIVDQHRTIGGYVGRILRGEKLGVTCQSSNP